MFFERYNYLLLMVQQGTACRYPALSAVSILNSERFRLTV